MLIHCNKHPFTQSQKVVIPYGTYWSTFSIDRRSSDEQSNDRTIYVGLTYDGTGLHKVAKLQFEAKKCKEAVELSEEVEEELVRCHTMNKDLIIAFYREFVRLIDGNLALISQVNWKDQLQNIDAKLGQHGITHNFMISDHKGFICVYRDDPEEFIEAPRKAIYDKHLSNDEVFVGKSFWIVRLVVDERTHRLKLFRE